MAAHQIVPPCPPDPGKLAQLTMHVKPGTALVPSLPTAYPRRSGDPQQGRPLRPKPGLPSQTCAHHLWVFIGRQPAFPSEQRSEVFKSQAQDAAAGAALLPD